jgi:hypothetical protein
MPSVQRSTLFYGQYQWCARFHMPECHALRRLDHGWIDRTIAQRRRWGRKLVARPVGSWQRAWETLEIGQDIENNLHLMCDFLVQDHTSRRIRIQEDQMFVYSNDPELFDRMQSLRVCQLGEVTDIQLSGTPGAVNLRSSDHGLRTYLRASRLTARTAESLRGFLRAQQDIRLSPSLAAWCDNTWLWTQRHFFYDHHSATTTNMLELIAPGLAKSTLPISTDK